MERVWVTSELPSACYNYFKGWPVFLTSFQAPVFTEPQLIVHSVSRQPAAQAAFGNPLFEYHASSPRCMSQGDLGEFEEFKEQY